MVRRDADEARDIGRPSACCGSLWVLASVIFAMAPAGCRSLAGHSAAVLTDAGLVAEGGGFDAARDAAREGLPPAPDGAPDLDQPRRIVMLQRNQGAAFGGAGEDVVYALGPGASVDANGQRGVRVIGTYETGKDWVPPLPENNWNDGFVLSFDLALQPDDTLTFGDGGVDGFYGAVAVAGGGLWLAGTFEGPQTILGKTIATVGVGKQSLAVHLAAPADATAGQIIQFGDKGNDEARAIAVDSGKSVWVLGEFEGKLFSIKSHGGRDIYLARFHQGLRDGAWVLGGSGDDAVGGMTIDAAGRVSILVTVTPGAAIVPSPTSGLPVVSGTSAALLLRFSQGIIDPLQVGGAPGNLQRAGGIAADAKHGVWVTLESMLSGKVDCQIMHVDSTLTAGRSLTVGGPGNDHCPAIAVDGSSVWVAGDFSGKATFGTAMPTAVGVRDVFALRIDAKSEPPAILGLHVDGGQSATVEGRAILSDGKGGAWVAGVYQGSFAPGTGAARASAGMHDIFVQQLAR